MPSRIFWMTALASATIVGGILWTSADDPPAQAAAGGPAAAAAMPATRPAVPPAAVDEAVPFRTGLERLPASLAGTAVGGELEEDLDGRLKVTRGVRNVFEYFLSGEGEETRGTTVARIKAYVRSRLRPAAAAEATALLDTYLAYKDQLASQNSGAGGGGLAAALSRLRAMHDLRRRVFEPAVAAAFFGDDEVHDRYAADKIALLNDPDLAPEVKATRLAALRRQQPAALQQQMAETELVGTLDEVTAQWKAQGGSPAALRELRENLVGKEAANRLEALDRENADWNSRIESYLQQRDTLLQDPTLAESARPHRLQALKMQAFDPAERIRLEAIERIRGTSRVP